MMHFFPEDFILVNSADPDPPGSSLFVKLTVTGIQKKKGIMQTLNPLTHIILFTVVIFSVKLPPLVVTKDYLIVARHQFRILYLYIYCYQNKKCFDDVSYGFK